MDNTTQRMMMGAGGIKGQTQWATPGSFSFTVPVGVTSISAVSIGGGGLGSTYTGGDGANLRWHSNIAVTPLEVLTITIPASSPLSTPSAATISRGGTVLLSSSSAIGGSIGGGNGKAGEYGGGYTNGFGWSIGIPGGGGGAGGYNGDAGGGATGAPGTIYQDDSSGVAVTGGQQGGGVGSKGQGTTGTPPGGEGSGGGFGWGGPSGGAINASGTTTTYPGGVGGPACVRIIWGSGRAYPSTRTADE